MQIKIFNIPVNDNDVSVEEMNRFLRGNKILQIEKQFVSSGFWTFCVTYMYTPHSGENQRITANNKVDYKSILSEEEFIRFSNFRIIRKDLAKENAIPAYAVFTDEELANMSRLNEITISSLKTIKGLGDKRVEKYGPFFLTPLS